MDVFLGFSDVVGEDFHDCVFLVVHGWHYEDVHPAFVETSRPAFDGEMFLLW